MKVRSLSILIPCKNESECMTPLLTAIDAAFAKPKLAGLRYEVWLCGESKPAAFDTVEMNVTSWPEAAQLSVREATILAARQSTSDWVLVMDADLQHPPQAAADQLNLIEHDAIHIGTRTDLSALPWYRRIISQILIRIAQWKLHNLINDPLSGFFFCPRIWLAELDAKPGFKPLISLLKDARFRSVHQHDATHALPLYEFLYHFDLRRAGHSKADLSRLWQTIVAIMRSR
jgi:dolichol-phosphate mannosyltransferase